MEAWLVGLRAGHPVWVMVGDAPVRSRAAADYSVRWIDRLRDMAEEGTVNLASANDLGWEPVAAVAGPTVVHLLTLPVVGST